MAGIAWYDEDGSGSPGVWAERAQHGVVPRARRRPRYFWRRLAVLLACGALGAVALSVGQHLTAGATVNPALAGPCPHGQVRMPLAAGSVGDVSRCGTGYTARPGDTIWSVAVRFTGGGDPRPLEDELEAQIGNGVLQPGQLLVVPR